MRRLTVTMMVMASVVAVGPPLVHGSAAIPPGCVDHVAPPGDPEVAGDVRCAGLFIEFHHDGPGSSPKPLWAGQWAVTGSDGAVHRGWCINHRGVHPLFASAASPGPVSLPGDPDGRRSAYLTATYADLDDPLTAAALWAVFHWYAADAAGSNRSGAADAPLVPRLDDLARMTGRHDLQVRALELAADAAANAATADAPEAMAWWGTPAWADPHGVQPLLAAGVLPPTTTTTTTTSTTTTSTTTTSTTTTPSTVPPAAPAPTDPAAIVEPVELPPVPAAPATTLPATGGGAAPASLGLGLLTAGVGLLGAVRRRTLRR